MSSDVISHHRPRRKRGSWWTYFARRFGALLLTMLALGFASFLAPLVRPQTKALAPPPRLEAPVQAAQPEVQEIDVTPALAGPPPRSQRRIYRDPDRRVFGGVCAGISAYLDWDPLIMRIIFAVLIFAGGIGVGLYLVLWIVLPEAKTTAQKLEMRGDPVTIGNITDSVRQEFNTVKEKMNL